MILNIILGIVAQGCAINCAVFQARGDRGAWVINGLLATVALGVLIGRLS